MFHGLLERSLTAGQYALLVASQRLLFREAGSRGQGLFTVATVTLLFQIPRSARDGFGQTRCPCAVQSPPTDPL